MNIIIKNNKDDIELIDFHVNAGILSYILSRASKDAAKRMISEIRENEKLLNVNDCIDIFDETNERITNNLN